MNHTKEPWINAGNGDIVADADTPSGITDIASVYLRTDDANEANARRIVACVNSCAGFSTEDLENSTTDKRHRALIIADLTIANKRCEELLAALIGLIGSDDPDELRKMETVLQSLPAPDDDKAVSITAIHAILKAIK